MKALDNLVSKIDFIGPEFNFEINNSIRYRTIYGAVFSLITFIAALVIAIMFGQEVYQRKHPNVSSSREFMDYSKIYLKDFPLMFSFHYGNTTEIKQVERYLDFKVELFSLDLNSKVSYLFNYSLVPCTQQVEEFTKYKSYVQNILTTNPFKYYCINFDDSMSFQNEMATPNSTYIRILFGLCNTKRKGCEFNQDFYTFTPVIVTTFMDHYVASANYSNPVVPFVYRHAQTLTPYFNKIMYLHFTNNRFVSDDGWLLEDLREINYYKYDSFKLDINPTADTALKLIHSVVLESPRLRVKDSRVYLKVQELFARVGGIANAFLILITVLSYDFLRFKYLVFIRENTFKIMDKSISKEVAKRKSVDLINNSQNIRSSNLFSSNNAPVVDIENSGNYNVISFQPKLEAKSGIKISKLNLKKINNNNNNDLSENKIIASENALKDRSSNLSNNNLAVNQNNLYSDVILNKNSSSDSNKNKESNKIINKTLNKEREVCNRFLKDELADILFGDSTKEFKHDDEISYLNYLRAYLCFICSNSELKMRYNYELNRVKKLLDFKTFKHYLMNSYATQCKELSDKN